MVSTTMVIVSSAVLLIGLLFLYRLEYPFYYYIPGVIGRILKPAKRYEEVKWRKPDLVTAEPTTVPNIVFIIADDLGFNDLSSGSTGIKTPNIDSIAVDGATFTTAYAGHGTCSPSRASIFTGRYPSRIGFEYTAIPKVWSWIITRPITGNVVQPVFHSHLFDKVPTLDKMILPVSEVLIPQLLKQSNYSTGYIGK